MGPRYGPIAAGAIGPYNLESSWHRPGMAFSRPPGRVRSSADQPTVPRRRYGTPGTVRSSSQAARLPARRPRVGPVCAAVTGKINLARS
eukprot:764333-Hanusia_phi.AAC.2